VTLIKRERTSLSDVGPRFFRERARYRRRHRRTPTASWADVAHHCAASDDPHPPTHPRSRGPRGGLTHFPGIFATLRQCLKDDHPRALGLPVIELPKAVSRRMLSVADTREYLLRRGARVRIQSVAAKRQRVTCKPTTLRRPRHARRYAEKEYGLVCDLPGGLMSGLLGLFRITRQGERT
jgi:hypothetical protein